MDKMYIAKLMYHRWEEGPISGIEYGYKGTFAIFFYGCNLHCIYCQNSKISRVNKKELLQLDSQYLDSMNNTRRKDIKYAENKSLKKISYTSEELSDEMIIAEKNGAYTISFITGVWYYDLIVDTIKLARKKGLKIPIVYNSSGYEFVRHIKKFDGLIDLYLPDFKYFDDELGKKFSNVSNYFEVARECIEEMYNQTKKIIVRHLVLPRHTEDSKKILKYLYDKYKNKIYYSIMSQYTPITSNDLKEFNELKRKLTKREYEKVVSYAIDLGIKNAYIQEGEVAKESFIPDF